MDSYPFEPIRTSLSRRGLYAVSSPAAECQRCGVSKWLWENTLFHVRVNPAVEALPAKTYVRA
eukprot:scaffold33996_cov33-Attheya_sp.AAC.1